MSSRAWHRRSGRRDAFVWAAIDLDTKELLSFYASYRRSHINTLAFARMVLETCTNRPVILVDGGPWYPWALEGICRTFKERTRRFYNDIPSREEGLRNVNLFACLFMLWYNFLRRHQSLGRVPAEVSLS